MQDFYRKKDILVNSQEDLFELYLESAQENVEYMLRKFPEMQRVQKDCYMDWLVSMGICPQSLITRQSKYWLETVFYCDGEMGLNLPGRMEELPNLFFEALSVVRGEKSRIKEKEDK